LERAIPFWHFSRHQSKSRNLSQEDVAKTITMRHVAFRVDGAGFKQAQEEIRAKKIEFEFADHGVAHSLYINDPDGHRIEITTYDL
jgi:catechol-2,3-dioxygenase